ncbi:hypothetical protein NL108_008265 [Boleophthalmus pectinirostris]|nr:hypothetical protein NL108_008265 [Boleophthalmus pectinirostris]
MAQQCPLQNQNTLRLWLYPKNQLCRRQTKLGWWIGLVVPSKKIYYAVARQPTGSQPYWTDRATRRRRRDFLSSHLNELVLGRLTQTHQNHSVSSRQVRH